jgi:ribosome-associated protein
MDATVKSKKARDLGEFIAEHQGEETQVIQVSEITSWTDFFVITTVRSEGHLKGLVRNIQNFLKENDIPILHRHKKLNEEGWVLIDCGYIVIHLMNDAMREFYELEKLYFAGETLFQSSKSS